MTGNLEQHHPCSHPSSAVQQSLCAKFLANANLRLYKSDPRKVRVTFAGAKALLSSRMYPCNQARLTDCQHESRWKSCSFDHICNETGNRSRAIHGRRKKTGKRRTDRQRWHLLPGAYRGTAIPPTLWPTSEVAPMTMTVTNSESWPACLAPCTSYGTSQVIEICGQYLGKTPRRLEPLRTS